MKTLYLHIGHYKTGSSAIQKYCSDNAADLRANGYHYPSVARPIHNRTNHGDLSLNLAMKYGFTPPGWYGDSKDLDQVYQDLHDECRKSDCDRIVVSSEEFVQLAMRENAREAVMELKDRFSAYDTRIVFYIREPMALLKSWYNEVNKGSFATRTFPVFFTKVARSFLSQVDIYDSFAQVFGDDRMTVLTYKKKGLDHIREFLGAIGYPAAVPGNDLLSVQEAQDPQFLELVRLSKNRNHSYEEATLSEFGSLKTIARRVERINVGYSRLAALSDVNVPSELSLTAIFRHWKYLMEPVVEHKCANRKEAEIMRDAAVEAESYDTELAYCLMDVAHLIRPNGPFIARKLKEYQERLGQSTMGDTIVNGDL